MSPCSGCSILTTSAPQSARIRAALGTKAACATSSTRTPSSGLVTRSDSGELGVRTGVAHGERRLDPLGLPELRELLVPPDGRRAGHPHRLPADLDHLEQPHRLVHLMHPLLG